MPKSIYFTDDRYEQIVEAAKKCGFRVQRGRGSQLAQFVVWASNNACSGRLTVAALDNLSKKVRGIAGKIKSRNRRR